MTTIGNRTNLAAKVLLAPPSTGVSVITPEKARNFGAPKAMGRQCNCRPNRRMVLAGSEFPNGLYKIESKKPGTSTAIALISAAESRVYLRPPAMKN